MNPNAGSENSNDGFPQTTGTSKQVFKTESIASVKPSDIASMPRHDPNSGAALIAALRDVSTTGMNRRQARPEEAFDVAWSSGIAVAQRALGIEETSFMFAAGMDTEFMRHGLPQAAQADANRRIMLAKQPPLPPTIIGVGEETVTMPPSIMQQANRIHAIIGPRALHLFNIFCAGKKQMVSKLAAKMGAGSTPFIYLNQTLFRLLVIDRFMPQRKDSDPQYSDDEKNPQGEIQTALHEWAGPHLAQIISRRCEYVNISILAGLRECYKELDRQRVQTIEDCQKLGTRMEWAGEEVDTND